MPGRPPQGTLEYERHLASLLFKWHEAVVYCCAKDGALGEAETLQKRRGGVQIPPPCCLPPPGAVGRGRKPPFPREAGGGGSSYPPPNAAAPSLLMPLPSPSR